MVAHRKNVPTRKAYVPSGWFIVLTIMLCLGGAGWLGMMLVGDDDEPAARPTPTPSISLSPEPSKSTKTPAPDKTTAPSPKPSKTPKPTPSTTAAPVVQRTAIVSVLNNTSIVGAAKAFSGRVADAGWTLGGVGNWTGSIDGNTVYYPAGLQQQAELLAKDVGIARVRPSVAPMRMDRLTVILSPGS